MKEHVKVYEQIMCTWEDLVISRLWWYSYGQNDDMVDDNYWTTWDDEHGQTWSLDYHMLNEWRWTYRKNIDMRMTNIGVMMGLMTWWCMLYNFTRTQFVCIYKLGLVHVFLVGSKKRPSILLDRSRYFCISRCWFTSRSQSFEIYKKKLQTLYLVSLV